jgi:UDP-N-acetylmuramyl pentapeptide phosphotransferase/UDP-N-acetylglucosamine-1-phosphate transferase
VGFPALLGLACAAGVVTALLARLLVGVLARGGVLDHPNARSSHSRPTPRGGGAALVAVLAVIWALLVAPQAAPAAGTPVWVALAGFAGLAAVSFADDRAGLPWLPRLAAQGLAVAGVLAVLAAGGNVGIGAAAVLAALWLWHINAVNFMDGIDGITGVYLLSLGLAVVLFGWQTADASSGLLIIAGVALAAVSTGWLTQNWPPARIFLGDVGSVPLGFVSGGLLGWAAADGAGWGALAVAGLYFGDTVSTLAMRLARGERVWEAHRQHAYQVALQRGLPARRICLELAAVNAAMTLGALLLPAAAALACAVAAGGLLCWRWRHVKRPV